MANTLSTKPPSQLHVVFETGSLDDSELSKEVTLDIELQGSFSLHFPDVRVSGFRSVLASGFQQLRSSQALNTASSSLGTTPQAHWKGLLCFKLCLFQCLFSPHIPSPVKGSMLSLGSLIKANHSPYIAG